MLTLFKLIQEKILFKLRKRTITGCRYYFFVEKFELTKYKISTVSKVNKNPRIRTENILRSWS